ncbi:MAG: signal peptidase II [Clostridia bacterium]|nr:signal peptidase II [Clostridia bacterium]
MTVILWFILSAALLAADLVTKHLATALRGGEEIVVIKNVLSFNYVENPGGAWGIFRNSAWVIIAITSVALIVLPVLMIVYRKIHPLFSLSLSLIWAGAIGNYIGHVFSGYVVDFIQVKFISFPSFNVADCCITVGAVLLGVYIIFFDRYFFRDNGKKKKNAGSASASEVESEAEKKD